MTDWRWLFARALAPAAALALGASASAQAADPIMPLSDVHRGMSCTARSVVQGTGISTFAAEVLDVVTGDPNSGGPSILVRVSGPAVDVSGVGPGFSGSPVYCPDANGVSRNIGAIAQGLGEYGNKLALVTPIQAILGEPVPAPPSARHAPALLRHARPLGEPLVISGLSAPVAALFQRAAARVGRVLYSAPAGPAGGFPVQTLAPGSSVSVGLSNGAIQASAIGTVAYTDADRVWLFGHPLDAAGPRSLLLQDAYVYTVVDNPLPSPGTLGTYKLAVAGHDLGSVTYDGLSAVTGRVGPLPPRFRVHVVGQGTDTATSTVSDTEVASENDIGLPTGISSASLVAPMAVAQVAAQVLHGSPANQSGLMCVWIHLRERRSPLHFCNNYAISGGLPTDGQTPSGVPAETAAPYVSDIAQALSDLDAFELGVIHVTGIDVYLRLAHGSHQGFMVGGRAAGSASRGRTAHVRVGVQLVRGPRIGVTLIVPVARRVRRGLHLLRLIGTPADSDNSASNATVVAVVQAGTGGPNGASARAPGAPSLGALASQVNGIQRFTGVVAALSGSRHVTVVAGPPGVRLSGAITVALRVR